MFTVLIYNILFSYSSLNDDINNNEKLNNINFNNENINYNNIINNDYMI